MADTLKIRLTKAAREKLYYNDIQLTNFAHTELEKVIDHAVSKLTVKQGNTRAVMEQCTGNIIQFIDVAFEDAQARKAPMVDLLALNNAKNKLATLWPFF